MSEIRKIVETHPIGRYFRLRQLLVRNQVEQAWGCHQELYENVADIDISYAVKKTTGINTLWKNQVSGDSCIFVLTFQDAEDIKALHSKMWDKDAKMRDFAVAICVARTIKEKPFRWRLRDDVSIQLHVAAWSWLPGLQKTPVLTFSFFFKHRYQALLADHSKTSCLTMLYVLARKPSSTAKTPPVEDADSSQEKRCLTDIGPDVLQRIVFWYVELTWKELQDAADASLRPVECLKEREIPHGK